MNAKYRVLLILFTLFLIMGVVCVSVSAKDEVVYANLDASGNVEGIYVVNIFDVQNASTIVDYGPYSSVKNLVSDDEIKKVETYSDGDNKYEVSFGPGKLYYQGNPSNVVFPWNISFTFKLDGTEISPEDLAGKSGHLQIHMNISGDENNFFYKNYALTVTILLDSNTCLNIVAPDATMANNGANKQLTYTVLPNKGLDKLITCDVINFEFDEVNINGVRLSMNITKNDVTSSDIDDLRDGVKKLVDAFLPVRTGVEKTKSLIATVLPPTSPENKTIISAVGLLSSGVSSYHNNLLKLNANVADIDQKISDKINEVLDPLSSTPFNLKSFVSERNTDIDKVQFVIHTKKIEIPKKEYIAPTEKELSFFERILAVFGLA